MAVDARDINITRDQVADWLAAYDGAANIDDLRTYLEGKITDQDLKSTDVDVSQRSDFEGSEVPLIELLMADLPSYDGYNHIFE